MVIMITMGIHDGDSTHNQDHLIYPANFNPINRMVNIPQNPILDELEVSAMLSMPLRMCPLDFPLCPRLESPDVHFLVERLDNPVHS